MGWSLSNVIIRHVLDPLLLVSWAHKMHHKHTTKEDGESFGFLLVAKKYWDKIKEENTRTVN